MKYKDLFEIMESTGYVDFADAFYVEDESADPLDILLREEEFAPIDIAESLKTQGFSL